jgi:hypothetical protein
VSDSLQYFMSTKDKKKTGNRRCITHKERVLAESDDSSPSTQIIRKMIALDAKANTAIGTFSSVCTYCMTKLDRENGKGHKLYNRNSGATPVIYLCDCCLRNRKRKYHYLGVY